MVHLYIGLYRNYLAQEVPFCKPDLEEKPRRSLVRMKEVISPVKWFDSGVMRFPLHPGRLVQELELSRQGQGDEKGRFKSEVL